MTGKRKRKPSKKKAAAQDPAVGFMRECAAMLDRTITTCLEIVSRTQKDVSEMMRLAKANTVAEAAAIAHESDEAVFGGRTYSDEEEALFERERMRQSVANGRVPSPFVVETDT